MKKFKFKLSSNIRSGFIRDSDCYSIIYNKDISALAKYHYQYEKVFIKSMYIGYIDYRGKRHIVKFFKEKNISIMFKILNNRDFNK